VTSAAINFYDAHPGTGDLRREVLSGLASSPRAIPPKFFYDKRGSELFDAICELPEYYQTRTEMSILRSCVGDLVSLIGPDCLLVELGSGASKKVRLLLEELRPSSYLGVDISKEFLLSSTRSLASDYPWLDVHAACVDFSHTLDVPHCDTFEHKVTFFPGSSIGNFDPDDAIDLLRRIAQMMNTNGQLLIGVDLKKDISILNSAYNDAAGVTAEFNLNLLTRIRDELDSDIDPGAFNHHAFYNPARGRIEMHLVSAYPQRLRIEDHFFDLSTGETIHTENSYKYTIEEFAELAAAAGYQQQQVWTDESSLFSVQLLTTV
jgi:dimethylhistidine N-methyltransferase